jgi:hypothetical protein
VGPNWNVVVIDSQALELINNKIDVFRASCLGKCADKMPGDALPCCLFPLYRGQNQIARGESGYYKKIFIRLRRLI